MIHPSDLPMIGLAARHETVREDGAAAALEPPEVTPWMTYEIAREDGVWRILFHGCKAGRFDSFDAALAFARSLARECAALGRTACVALQPGAPPSKCETYPAREAAFGGLAAAHQA